MESKTAFVAMKFSGPPNTDKRYSAIKEPLIEAGFKVTRADELPTSGIVVDEVYKNLREADLVVIDSTGDSHSVSYEVGYCHGARRPADTIILLREGGGIPFNYQHYRHQIYSGFPDMQKKIRRVLGISDPISDSAHCNAMTFQIQPAVHIPPANVARAVRSLASHFHLSGRLETYANVGYIFVKESGIVRRVSMRKTPSDEPFLFSFAFVFRPSKGKNNRQGLEDMRDFLARALKAELEAILVKPELFDPASFESGPLGSVKSSMKPFSFIDLEDGAVKNLIEPLANPLAC